MTYKFGNKTITIPDAEIKSLMVSLDLTKDEAIETWLDDNDYTTNEEQQELDKKANAVKIDRETGNKAKGVRKQRERKVDAEKGYLLGEIKAHLPSGVENVEIKTETEISFFYNGNAYTLKLTKHRPPKN